MSSSCPPQGRSVALTSVDRHHQLPPRPLPTLLAFALNAAIQHWVTTSECAQSQPLTDLWALTEAQLGTVLGQAKIEKATLVKRLMANHGLVRRSFSCSALDSQSVLFARRFACNVARALPLPATPQQPKTPVQPLVTPTSKEPLTPTPTRVKRLRIASPSKLTKPFKSPLKASALTSAPSSCARPPRSMNQPLTDPVRQLHPTSSPLGGRYTGLSRQLPTPKRKLFTSTVTLTDPKISELSKVKSDLERQHQRLDSRARKVALIRTITKQNNEVSLDTLIEQWRQVSQAGIHYLYDQWRDLNPQDILQSSNPYGSDNEKQSGAQNRTQVTGQACPESNSPSRDGDAYVPRHMSLRFVLDMFRADYQLLGFDPEDEEFVS
ncbi:hypothetical protein H4R34_003745 [Dimargaris verticillata]|uniref:Swi5-dependent recombination DNA repair protein 1 homolog n=1 Tax=Dimargaris verticillata TaxID=2761393 RepID=A0A9W8B1J8_9FUNG|nr:hypothetical protein H4R34_003745 [Dimargaris verticillata]